MAKTTVLATYFTPKRASRRTPQAKQDGTRALKAPSLSAKKLGRTRPGIDDAFKIANCECLSQTEQVLCQNFKAAHGIKGEVRVSSMEDRVELEIKILTTHEKKPWYDEHASLTGKEGSPIDAEDTVEETAVREEARTNLVTPYPKVEIM